ncbi:nucleotidyltransferase family protein [Actinokineospora pegani]|uniref:nucleotidyltransferase family protein n=1 Tax=Actinokineospora pegani TaxID=2654637 RepID=UPI0018D3C3D6|nr:nucleotidyltransferase family protein [Actinokineospora pegani]
MPVVGVVLAAGGGRRFGAPKALVRFAGRTLVDLAVAAVSGCDAVVVVVGAAGDEVRDAVAGRCSVVGNPEWETGMGSSLRAGLAAAESIGAGDAVVVATVDTPGVTRAAVERVAALAGPDALARAVYEGTPGHPVLLGRSHWGGVAASARGDAGARAYLRGRDVVAVECADVAVGSDVDTPEDLAALVERLGGQR